jgi:hypothetical protein
MMPVPTSSTRGTRAITETGPPVSGRAETDALAEAEAEADAEAVGLADTDATSPSPYPKILPGVLGLS